MPKARTKTLTKAWGWLRWFGLGLGTVLAGLYALVLLQLWRSQEGMLFPAFGPDYTECHDIVKLGYRPRSLSRYGEQVRFLWWQAPRPQGTVLLFHGNGGTVCYRAFHAEHLRDRRWNVALLEYPGYGPRSGQAGQASMLRNGLAAFDALKADQPGLPLLLFGKSLGGGPATYVASQRDPVGLIVHTPYPSLTEVASRRFLGLVPIRSMIRHPMPARDWAPQARCPVLAIHGEADGLIPIDLGREQAAQFKDLEFVSIAGAGHNDLAWKDFERYWGAIHRFCERRFGASRKALPRA